MVVVPEALGRRGTGVSVVFFVGPRGYAGIGVAWRQLRLDNRSGCDASVRVVIGAPSCLRCCPRSELILCDLAAPLADSQSPSQIEGRNLIPSCSLYVPSVRLEKVCLLLPWGLTHNCPHTISCALDKVRLRHLLGSGSRFLVELMALAKGKAAAKSDGTAARSKKRVRGISPATSVASETAGGAAKKRPRSGARASASSSCCCGICGEIAQGEVVRGVPGALTSHGRHYWHHSSAMLGCHLWRSLLCPALFRALQVTFVQHEPNDEASSVVYLCSDDDKVYSMSMSHIEVGAAIQQYKTDRLVRKRWQVARGNLQKPEAERGFRTDSVTQEVAMDLTVSKRVSILNASEWTRYFKSPPLARVVRFIPQLVVPNFKGDGNEVVDCFSYDPRLPLRYATMTQRLSSCKTSPMMTSQAHLWEGQGEQTLQVSSESCRSLWTAHNLQKVKPFTHYLHKNKVDLEEVGWGMLLPQGGGGSSRRCRMVNKTGAGTLTMPRQARARARAASRPVATLGRSRGMCPLVAPA